MEGPIDRRQKRGQELYRAKDYKAALDCFNAVILEDADPPLSIWDNRAATYTKLGDLQSALRDGKRMIHQDKAEVSGYLRTGVILKLMGEDEVALKIYRYGLKNVPISHADIKLLRGMHDKLAASCMPPKATDPLLALPLELVEMVIRHLSFNNLVGLLRVSKSWKQIIESMPSLWRHLDLSNAKKNVRQSAIRECVKRSQGKLTRVTLSRFEHYNTNNEILKYITSRCKALEYLELRDGVSNASLLKAVSLALKLTTLIIGRAHETSFDLVTQLLAQCHTLERAEFHSTTTKGIKAEWRSDLSTLRVLKLDAGKPQQLDTIKLNLNALLEKAPNLRELSLQSWRDYGSGSIVYDFSVLTHLEVLDLAGFNMSHFPRIPASLRSLDLTECYSINCDTQVSQVNIKDTNLQDLHSLSLSPGKWPISYENLQTLLRPSKSLLKKFSYLCCAMEDNISSLIQEGYLVEVTELNLHYSSINDKIAELIAENLPRLKILDLAATSITGVGVKALVLKLGDRLEKLNLMHCTSVSSDAVDFARAKGVHVTYSFPDMKGKGKKVRGW